MLRIIIRNPFYNKSYPDRGSILAVLDTGYEGFLAIPRDLFKKLALDKLKTEKRTLLLSNGSLLTSEGAYGRLETVDPNFRLDGFIETYDGLDEIILGVNTLTNFKLILDYCLRKLKIERCA